ncbi:MAG: glycosyltransferase family protein [Bacteroidota bacterium]
MHPKSIKILYGIQGTGNGHISRSLILIEALAKEIGIDNIDILISGKNYSLDIPYKIKYQFAGLSFNYGNAGKVALWKSIRNLQLKDFTKDIKSIPFHNYDIVLTDQEPISAWGAKKYHIPSIGIGNIYALESTSLKRLFLHKLMTKCFQKIYCPVKNKIVLDFTRKHSNTFYPLLSDDFMQAKVKHHSFTLVYLLSYSLYEILEKLSDVQLVEQCFVVYSKEVQYPLKYKNIYIKPISKSAFKKDLMNCSQLISTAGFQTIAEALFMQKKILLIPIKGQPEQKANAIMLSKHHVKRIRKLDVDKIHSWLFASESTPIVFTDDKKAIVQTILRSIQPTNSPSKLTFA